MRPSPGQILTQFPRQISIITAQFGAYPKTPLVPCTSSQFSRKCNCRHGSGDAEFRPSRLSHRNVWTKSLDRVWRQVFNRGGSFPEPTQSVGLWYAAYRVGVRVLLDGNHFGILFIPVVSPRSKFELNGPKPLSRGCIRTPVWVHGFLSAITRFTTNIAVAGARSRTGFVRCLRKIFVGSLHIRREPNGRRLSRVDTEKERKERSPEVWKWSISEGWSCSI